MSTPIIKIQFTRIKQTKRTRLARDDLSLLVVATNNYLTTGEEELLLRDFTFLCQYYKGKALVKALCKIASIYPNSKQAKEEVQDLIFSKYPELQPQFNYSTPLF